MIAGLMCIPPVEEEPAMHFAFLAKLAAENGLAQLSMGMSDDFETAIAVRRHARARRLAPSSARDPKPEVFQWQILPPSALPMRCGC